MRGAVGGDLRLGLPAFVGTWVAGGLVAVLLNTVYRWLERRLRRARPP